MLDEGEVRRLLLRTAGRDAAAFHALYRKASPLLMAVAQRIVGRKELAEEVLHDAFVRIWNHAERFDALAPNAVAWMVAITRNRALDLVSSAAFARTSPLADDTADALMEEALGADRSAQELVESSRQASSVRDCLAELRAVERQALVLAYHHGLSHAELARSLQKPLGTVKAWVRRALDKMRVCIESCMGEGGEARRAP